MILTALRAVPFMLEPPFSDVRVTELAIEANGRIGREVGKRWPVDGLEDNKGRFV